MEQNDVRTRIRQLHDTGELPCTDGDGKVWAGRGTGDHCALCAEPITPAEAEYEIDLPSGLCFRVHRGCYDLWLEECSEVLGSR
jgi:hypothetical protein